MRIDILVYQYAFERCGKWINGLLLISILAEPTLDALSTNLADHLHPAFGRAFTESTASTVLRSWVMLVLRIQIQVASSHPLRLGTLTLKLIAQVNLDWDLSSGWLMLWLHTFEDVFTHNCSSRLWLWLGVDSSPTSTTSMNFLYLKSGFDLNDHPSYCCHAWIDEQFMSSKLMETLYKS